MRDWTLYNPDLKPIRHLWFLLKQAIHEICPHFDDITDKETIRTKLEELLPEAWRSIGAYYIRQVLQSMPNRLQAVTDALGWQTGDWALRLRTSSRKHHPLPISTDVHCITSESEK